jgi:hypothetical protein
MKPMDFSAVQILEVPESHVMSDATGRQVIAYAMLDNPHAKGLLMAYVPSAKLGFVTDVWSPGTPMPDKPNPGLISVVRNREPRRHSARALRRRPRLRRALRDAHEAHRTVEAKRGQSNFPETTVTGKLL